MLTENEIAKLVVDLCFKIHIQYGPGLFESVYEEIFCYEWQKNGIPFLRQYPVPLIHEEIKCGGINAQHPTSNSQSKQRFAFAVQHFVIRHSSFAPLPWALDAGRWALKCPPCFDAAAPRHKSRRITASRARPSAERSGSVADMLERFK